MSPIISGMQKCAAPFVEASFCGGRAVRPNMLNMPKSAAVSVFAVFNYSLTEYI